MSIRGKSSRELGRELSQIVARAAHMAPAAIVGELDQIEKRALAAVTRSERLQLETRRRIAEWKFKLLGEQDLPYAEIAELHQGVLELGFTDLETEATIQIYFAQYCMRQSHPRKAKSILQLLRTKLEASSAPDHLKRDAARALASLED